MYLVYLVLTLTLKVDMAISDQPFNLPIKQSFSKNKPEMHSFNAQWFKIHPWILGLCIGRFFIHDTYPDV